MNHHGFIMYRHAGKSPRECDNCGESKIIHSEIRYKDGYDRKTKVMYVCKECSQKNNNLT